MDHDSPDKPMETEGRQRILMAAYPLFVEHGYKAVSMQQIADAARIHKATLYHHFEHKDALFMAVVRIELDQARREMVDGIAQGHSAPERLAGVAWRYFQRSHADFGRLMSDVHEHLSPDDRQTLLKAQPFPLEQLEDIFRQATAAGELPEVDTTLAAGMFTGLIWGQIWIRKLERETEPLTEALARRLVEILLAGLRDAPAALAPAEPATATAG
jgi:AcrR family transcriptional regulator